MDYNITPSGSLMSWNHKSMIFPYTIKINIPPVHEYLME